MQLSNAIDAAKGVQEMHCHRQCMWRSQVMLAIAY